MIKRCPACSHTGELNWRDGKYYCAMCGKEVAETEPEVKHASVVNHVTCPICKNKENNLVEGDKYRCALCGTPFDLQQAPQTSYSEQFANVKSTIQANSGILTKAWEALKKGDTNIVLGIIFFFVFWPVSIYFFYKFYKTVKQ